MVVVVVVVVMVVVVSKLLSERLSSSYFSLFLTLSIPWIQNRSAKVIPRGMSELELKPF